MWISSGVLLYPTKTKTSGTFARRKVREVNSANNKNPLRDCYTDEKKKRKRVYRLRTRGRNSQADYKVRTTMDVALPVYCINAKKMMSHSINFPRRLRAALSRKGECTLHAKVCTHAYGVGTRKKMSLRVGTRFLSCRALRWFRHGRNRAFVSEYRVSLHYYRGGTDRYTRTSIII